MRPDTRCPRCGRRRPLGYFAVCLRCQKACGWERPSAGASGWAICADDQIYADVIGAMLKPYPNGIGGVSRDRLFRLYFQDPNWRRCIDAVYAIAHSGCITRAELLATRKERDEARDELDKLLNLASKSQEYIPEPAEEDDRG